MTNEKEAMDATVSPPRAASAPVLHVTMYERVTSMLLALILTTGCVSAALGVLWASNHLTIAGTPPARVHIVPYDPYGGGEQNGAEDGDPSLPGPVGEIASAAENSDRPNTDMNEMNQLERTIAELSSRITDDALLAADLTPTRDVGISVGRIGKNDRRPLGTGPGDDGGTRAAERWEINFESGLTEHEYARRLDFLEIELGVVLDGKLYRVSQVSTPKPAARVTEPRLERGEVVLIWRAERRRQVDLGFIRASGAVVPPDDAPLLHFLPKQTASKLAKLERDYATQHNRPNLKFVSKTRFAIQQSDAGYTLEVVQQRYGIDAARQSVRVEP